jgi:hypothetical protein
MLVHVFVWGRGGGQGFPHLPLHWLSCRPRYVSQLESQFTQRVNQLFKLKTRLSEAVNRNNDLVKSVAKLQPELNRKIDEVLDLKSCVEADISKLYDNRAVHIIGAINTLRS